MSDYISTHGEFVPYVGASAGCLIDNPTFLMYIREHIERSVLGLYYKPIPPNNYNIKIYNIWEQSSPMTRLQITNLHHIADKIPNKYDDLLSQVGHEPKIGINLIQKELAIADHVLKNKMPISTTVVPVSITSGNVLFLNMIWLDPKVSDHMENLSDCLYNIFHTVKGVYSYGIVIGYKYRDVSKHHIDIVSDELHHLIERISNNHSTLVVRSPRILVYDHVNNVKVYS